MPRTLRKTRRTARRTAATRAVLAVAALALTACGSQVDAATMARLNGQGGVVVGADGQPVTAADGSVPGSTGGDTGAGTTGGAGTAGSGDSSGGGDAGSGGGDAPVGEGRTAADGGVRAGSCDGFENSTGITDEAITIANVADISGPVPGLFQAAQDATKAFVSYYNQSNPDGICGRSLTLSALDTRSDAGGDQQAYTRACAEAFAAVGSVSSQDQGGAATAEECGLPDLRAFTVTPQRAQCASCFSAYSLAPNLHAQAISDYLRKTQPEGSKAMSIYYVDVPAAKVNAESFAAAFEKQGLTVKRVQGIDTSEFNYAPYAQQMKSDGARLVQYFGPYQFTIRLQEAMQQQGVDAQFFTDPTVYDRNYVEQGGDAVDGTLVYSVVQLFDDQRIPEMVLYRQWLERVAPGSIPNYYGLFAWSAARLFVQEATELGGKLSRPALVQAVKGVKDWTSNGIHAPMAIGAKQTPGCIKFIQLDGDTWKQVSPGDFLCGPVFDSGVGG
jgi:ABC-type branched-subunit amino acid transport system substrate-binding protein